MEEDINRPTEEKGAGAGIRGAAVFSKKAALRGDYTQIRRGSLFPNQLGTIERGGTSDRNCSG